MALGWTLGALPCSALARCHGRADRRRAWRYLRFAGPTAVRRRGAARCSLGSFLIENGLRGSSRRSESGPRSPGAIIRRGRRPDDSSFDEMAVSFLPGGGLLLRIRGGAQLGHHSPLSGNSHRLARLNLAQVDARVSLELVYAGHFHTLLSSHSQLSRQPDCCAALNSSSLGMLLHKSSSWQPGTYSSGRCPRSVRRGEPLAALQGAG
jgi:hypothetical protein